MSDSSKQDIQSKLNQIGKLLASRKHDDYEALLDRLWEAQTLFHDMLAEQLTEPFNAYLSSLPAETAEQKKAVARCANADLRELGLTIRCPKTSEPAHLRGSPDSTTGRFQICLTSDPNYGRTLTSKTLPRVELMARPAGRTQESSLSRPWSERVQGSGDIEPRR